MGTKVRCLTILFVCIIVVIGAFSSYGQKKDSRPVISDGERARAMWEVQNVMSKHNYYHAAQMHAQELKDIWVKEDGIFAASATFANSQRIMLGLDTIKADYGRSTGPTGKGSWSIHLNTTPVIEIAGDGKTAKGIWYSPGVHVGFSDGDKASGGWWWEKYGADFVKEDGKWKIWHIQMYYDHTPSISAETGSTLWTTPTRTGGRTYELKPGEIANPDPYEGWGPDFVPVIRPELPEPYYTFSETFSYCQETARGPYPRK